MDIEYIRQSINQISYEIEANKIELSKRNKSGSIKIIGLLVKEPREGTATCKSGKNKGATLHYVMYTINLGSFKGIIGSNESGNECIVKLQNTIKEENNDQLLNITNNNPYEKNEDGTLVHLTDDTIKIHTGQTITIFGSDEIFKGIKKGDLVKISNFCVKRKDENTLTYSGEISEILESRGICDVFNEFDEYIKNSDPENFLVILENMDSNMFFDDFFYIRNIPSYNSEELQKCLLQKNGIYPVFSWKSDKECWITQKNELKASSDGWILTWKDEPLNSFDNEYLKSRNDCKNYLFTFYMGKEDIYETFHITNINYWKQIGYYLMSNLNYITMNFLSVKRTKDFDINNDPERKNKIARVCGSVSVALNLLVTDFPKQLLLIGIPITKEYTLEFLNNKNIKNSKTFNEEFFINLNETNQSIDLLLKNTNEKYQLRAITNISFNNPDNDIPILSNLTPEEGVLLIKNISNFKKNKDSLPEKIKQMDLSLPLNTPVDMIIYLIYEDKINRISTDSINLFKYGPDYINNQKKRKPELIKEKIPELTIQIEKKEEILNEPKKKQKKQIEKFKI